MFSRSGLFTHDTRASWLMLIDDGQTAPVRRGSYSVTPTTPRPEITSPSILFPLPIDPTLVRPEYDQFARNDQTYLTTLTDQLNELLAAAYLPDLTLIEELMKSIEISDTTLHTKHCRAFPDRHAH